MKLITKKNRHRKSFTVLTLGTVVTMPLLNAPSAQAAPPYNAPVKSADTDSRNVTLRGTVTQDLSGNDFTMRATDGRTYRVLTRSEPGKLSKGDVIEVRGWIENNIFVANKLRIVTNNGNTTNNGNSWGQTVNIRGTVTTDLRGEVFEMRGTNGHSYIVVARNEPKRLSRSDLVHVQGRLDSDGKTIIANSVTLTRDANGSNSINKGNVNWNNGSPMNFTGVVTRIASPYRLDVRADNNKNFSINSVEKLSSRVSVGDGVRIIGNNLGNSIVRATQVQLTKDTNSGGWNNGNWNRNTNIVDSVNFPAVIQSLKFDGDVTVMGVRGDNGQVYSVRYRTNTRFTIGQRVRIAGKINNGVIYATSVTR